MLTTIAKPTCLFFGQDSEFLEKLQEHFGARVEIKLATAETYTSILFGEKIDLAVFLWNRLSASLAKEFHQSYPHIEVVMERNKKSFQGQIKRNGYASLVDRTQDRWELIDEIDNALLKIKNRDRTKLSPSASTSLSLASFIERLSQVLANLATGPKLFDHVLEAVLVGFRSNRGGLFLRKKGTDDFQLVSARRLDGLNKLEHISAQSEIASSLFASDKILYQLCDGEIFLKKFFDQTGCNVLFPIGESDARLGFIICKISGQLCAAQREQVYFICLLLTEIFELALRQEEKFQETTQLHALVGKMVDVCMLVDPQGVIQMVQDPKEILQYRRPISGASYTQLTSPTLKNAIYQAFSGYIHNFTLSDSISENVYWGQAAPMDDGGAMVSLRVSPNYEKCADDAVSFDLLAIVKTLELSELREDEALSLLKHTRCLGSGLRDIPLMELQNILKTCPSLLINELPVDDEGSYSVNALDAAILLIVLAKTINANKVAKGKITLKALIHLINGRSNLIIDIHYPHNFRSELMDLGKSLLINLPNLSYAKFGLRVVLRAQDLRKSQFSVSAFPKAEQNAIQSGKIVLHTAPKKLIKLSNGSDEESPIACTHYR